MLRFWTPLCLASTLALGLTLSACNDDSGDNVQVDAVEPGDDCAEGGLKITVNGTSHFSCNSEKPAEPTTTITSEYIPFGEEGNPCPGDALRVTLNEKGEEPAIAWSCNADVTPATPSATALYNLLIYQVKGNLIIQANYQACDFEADPDNSHEPIYTQDYVDAVIAIMDSCILDHINLLPELSNEILPPLSCMLEAQGSSINCLEQNTKDGAFCWDPEDPTQPMDLQDYCVPDLSDLDCSITPPDGLDSENARFSILLNFISEQCGLLF